MITNIKIENIKGFGSDNNNFDVEIQSQKVNIMVAPNGFGKSSITVAFDSLIRGKIKVEENNMHRKDSTLVPSLSIKLDGVNLIANPTTNTISSKLTCCTINNRLKVQTISKTFNGYSTTKGFLSIDSVTVVDSIPEKFRNYINILILRTTLVLMAKYYPTYQNCFLRNAFWKTSNMDLNLWGNLIR